MKDQRKFPVPSLQEIERETNASCPPKVPQISIAVMRVSADGESGVSFLGIHHNFTTKTTHPFLKGQCHEMEIFWRSKQFDQ